MMCSVTEQALWADQINQALKGNYQERLQKCRLSLALVVPLDARRSIPADVTSIINEMEKGPFEVVIE